MTDVPPDIVKAVLSVAPEAAKAISKQTRTLSPARFATCCALVALGVLTVPVTVWIYGKSAAPTMATNPTDADRNRDRKVLELSQKVQELMASLEQTNASLEFARKDIEARDAQLRDSQQKLAALAKDVSVVKADVSVVKTKVASAPSDFAKALMAQARETLPSFATTPNKVTLPPSIETPSADLSKDGERLRCRPLFNEYLLCEPYHPTQQ